MTGQRCDLEEAGFSGFFSFEDLRRRDIQIPEGPGCYAVLKPPGFVPCFLEQSAGGRLKKKDPSVAQDILERNWVEAADVLYTGKADSGVRGRRGLRKRLEELSNFGDGRPVGHWGGRFLLQLHDAQSLLVCWKLCEMPKEIEAEMLRDFVSRFGQRPFANLTGGMT